MHVAYREYSSLFEYALSDQKLRMDLFAALTRMAVSFAPCIVNEVQWNLLEFFVICIVGFFRLRPVNNVQQHSYHLNTNITFIANEASELRSEIASAAEL